MPKTTQSQRLLYSCICWYHTSCFLYVKRCDFRTSELGRRMRVFLWPRLSQDKHLKSLENSSSAVRSFCSWSIPSPLWTCKLRFSTCDQSITKNSNEKHFRVTDSVTDVLYCWSRDLTVLLLKEKRCIKPWPTSALPRYGSHSVHQWPPLNQVPICPSMHKAPKLTNQIPIDSDSC